MQNRGHDLLLCPRLDRRPRPHQPACPTAAGRCEKVFREKISGTTADRPKLRKLIPSPPGDVVITPAVDRLSRDTTDLLIIAREMQRAGAGIRSLAEPYLDTTSDFAEVVFAILGVAAKLERRRILELSAALRTELLDRIRAAPPAFFEHLIIDLMLAMGYGAGGGGQRLGRPNDEGVDGVISEDALGLDTVYLQAKRYAADLVVGIKDIQAFIGALVGHGASKGVFVTTSHFSNQAHDFAHKATHRRVILIDGGELTRLLVRYGVGVRTARTIDLRRIDENYFETSE